MSCINGDRDGDRDRDGDGDGGGKWTRLITFGSKAAIENKLN